MGISILSVYLPTKQRGSKFTNENATMVRRDNLQHCLHCVMMDPHKNKPIKRMRMNGIHLTLIALLVVRWGGADAFIGHRGALVTRLASTAPHISISSPSNKVYHILNYQQKNYDTAALNDTTVGLLNQTVNLITTPKDEEALQPASTHKSPAPFTPWPISSVVHSNGNYIEETYLEQHIGGPLYENNNRNKLPQLPIPTLQETLDKFLPTALPLCESQEEKDSLLKACDTFIDEANHLQERLIKRKDDLSSLNSSWLQEWWNKLGYLQVRDPVAVHVSYFLNIDDDSSLPTQEEIDAASSSTATANYEDHDDLELLYYGATNPGILRGAAAITAAATVRKRICSGQAPCDKVHSIPLCSTGFKYLFNANRIPMPGSDIYKMYDPCLHKHCIVAKRGYFFALDFVDDEANPLPLDMLVHRLVLVEEMAKRQEALGMPKLGFLTGCHRDFWAEARSQLLNEGGKRMIDAMELLESGAFVLCLDEVWPKTQSEANEVFWHGNSGGNRWFDKSIQLVCMKDGQVALVGEHSLFDGSLPMTICKQLQKSTYKRLRRMDPPSHDQGVYAEPSLDDIGVYDIFGQCLEGNRGLTTIARELANKGKKQYQELTESVELKTLLHEGYGKRLLKKRKISPDAFLQLAIQLAAYRVFGKQLATYEATQTRSFVHGRTETTRTVSLDSQAFVQAMGFKSKANIDDVEKKCAKLQLLRKAAETHHVYTVEASSGRGVDRHFLGLSLVLQDNEVPPSLFGHPVFLRSKTWRLSTSSLPYCPGFGPVVHNGLGIGYGLSNNSCVFNISSRRENDYVNRFCDELEKALVEMQGLLEVEESFDSMQ